FLEEGKTMGLAPYGNESEIYAWLQQFVKTQDDGQYFIDDRFIQAMFHLSEGAKYYRWGNPDPTLIPLMSEINRILGSSRKKGEGLTQTHKNLAWAGQKILEDVVLGLAKRTQQLTGSENLCLAGGVALNSVANGKIVDSGMFKNIFIQPAAGDEGQALGKLFHRLHNQYKLGRFFHMKNAYLGPIYSDSLIQDALLRYSSDLIYNEYKSEELVRIAAKHISEQKIIGWYQGGSEIGPRALGHRSILADPRPKNMRDRINFQVKHREWFRPLAPSVLEERAAEYFDAKSPLPFMLVVCKVHPDKEKIIPAVIHVDGTARLQTVNENDNGLYYNLIQAFDHITGVPVVLNTSFNHAGEPIVETPDDAIKAFMRMNLDFLVIGNFIVKRK
ncbi:MAG: carbamoyltransferase C-terminal domain-containing protein, partial [Patescibacteria group bacterium]